MLVSAEAAEHDLWIVPEKFNLFPGDKTGVSIWVGTSEESQCIPRNNDRIDRFASICGRTETELEGLSGADDSALGCGETDAFETLIYQSRPRELALANNDFEEFITKMGLEAVAESFQATRNLQRVQVEEYIRCAKSLIRVGDPRKGYDKVLGVPLELVLRMDPRGLSPGRALRVGLLRKKRPVEGVLLRARCLGREGEVISARTDSLGDAYLDVELGGQWLIAAVGLREAPDPPEGEEKIVDWVSTWTTLTFSF